MACWARTAFGQKWRVATFLMAALGHFPKGGVPGIRWNGGHQRFVSFYFWIHAASWVRDASGLWADSVPSQFVSVLNYHWVGSLNTSEWFQLCSTWSNKPVKWKPFSSFALISRVAAASQADIWGPHKSLFIGFCFPQTSCSRSKDAARWWFVTTWLINQQLALVQDTQLLTLQISSLCCHWLGWM